MSRLRRRSRASRHGGNLKLLLDENISHRLLPALSAHFPESTHVRFVGLQAGTDDQVWEFARQHGFAIVTRDADFYERQLLEGSPPRIVWLVCGNSSTTYIESVLLRHKDRILELDADPSVGCITVG